MISLLTIEWLQNNCMKLNQDKCHLWYLVINMKMFGLNTGDEIIWESNKKNVTGVANR